MMCTIPVGLGIAALRLQNSVSKAAYGAGKSRAQVSGVGSGSSRRSPSDHGAGNSELLFAGAVERGAGHRKGGAVEDLETCLDGERRGMLGAVHEIDVIRRRAVRRNIDEHGAARLEATMGEAKRPDRVFEVLENLAENDGVKLFRVAVVRREPVANREVDCAVQRHRAQ